MKCVWLFPQGAQVFCVKGIIGLIEIKDDWTNGYEVKNTDGETILIAQRFNRLSGGYEFQVRYSENFVRIDIRF